MHRCNLCQRNSPYSLQIDLRRMNSHRANTHQTPSINSDELERFESCHADRSGPKNSYKEVSTTLAHPTPEDFRSESIHEHRLGLLRYGCIFNDGESGRGYDISMFHVLGPKLEKNPYLEDVTAFLDYGNVACNKKGSHLLRQQMLRNAGGQISALTFRCVQPDALKTYAANVAKLVFFASRATWDTHSHTLTNTRTILHSLLFEPNIAISQTYMVRFAKSLEQPLDMSHCDMSHYTMSHISFFYVYHCQNSFTLCNMS
jgi:hypothetical protein